MRRLLLSLSLLFIAVLCHGSATNAYVTPTGGATGNCPAGATTFDSTGFNNSANWGAGANQIGAGTTVLICGTFTFGSGSTGLIPQGSGSAGSDITLAFDTGAIIQAPYFEGNPETNCASTTHCGGGISIPNLSYITIDGRNTGIIQNTANGSILANQQSSVGIYGRGDHILIKNLTIRNIYVNCPQGIACADTQGFFSAGIRVDGGATNVEICGNTSTASHRGISTDTSGGTGGNTVATCVNTEAATGVNIHHNTVSDHGWQIIATGSGTPNIYNNTASDWSNWVYPTGGFYHLDGIITFGDAGLTITPFIYNNYIFGDMTINGGFPTGFIFCSYGGAASASACTIFNNVLQGTGSYASQGQGIYLHGGDGSHTMGPHKMYNNVFLGFATGQLYQEGDTGIVDDVRNNIFSGNGAQWFIQGNTSTNANLTINHNDYFSGRGHPWSWGNDNTATTLAAWRTVCSGAGGTGCDATASVADPLLDGTFHPGVSSPVIGLGENLTSLGITALNLDKAGVARPSVGAWATGAYQFGVSALTPASLSFGDQVLTTVALNQTITFANTSGSLLNIISISVSGDFQVIDSCPDVLTIGDICLINVTFTPQSLGAASGTLTIVTNALNSPQTAPLTGNGVAIGREFFTSITGNDANTGADNGHAWLHVPGMPNCTGNCATTTPTAGDIYNLRASVWKEATVGGVWTMSWSGTPGHPITFRTYPGDVASSCGTPPCYAFITRSKTLPHTFVNDANDALESHCTTPSCTTFYLNLDPATTRNFESLNYNGIRRSRPQMSKQNGCQNSNNATMCKAGANQAAADAACGCPAGVAGQPAPYNHCSAKISPCAGGTPWQCFNQAMFTGTDINCNYHNMTLGDIEFIGQERWTMSRDRVLSCSGNLLKFTGPTWTTSDAGCLPRFRYLLENVRDLLAAGGWVLDRCPEQDDPVHCNGNQLTPSTINWRLYIGAAVGEDPNVDTIIVPQADPAAPQLLTGMGRSYLNFQQLSFQYDNVIPGSFGWADSEGMPLVASAIAFSNSDHIVFEGVTRYHMQGWCGPEFTGASSYILIENGTGYDCGAGGIRIGDTASASDTDLNVPHHISILNEAEDGTGRVQATGEATVIHVGDAHDIQVSHIDCFGHYTGCSEGGHGLDRGATNGDFAYFMYNNWYTFIHTRGETIGNNTVGFLHDFGGLRAMSNLSTKCASALTAPTLIPNTYCSHIKWNFVELEASSYTEITKGANGIYLDQGASNVEVRFNVVSRVAHTASFVNSVSNKAHGNPGARLLESNNLVSNNIYIGCGAQQYDNPPNQSPSCITANGTFNRNQVEFSHNVILYNSANAERFQSAPNTWGAFDYSDLLIVNAGGGFTSEPTVAVAGCSGASVSPTISYTTGKLIGTTIANAGTSCPASPSVTVTGGGGSGAVVTACTSGGSLVACTFPAIPATALWNFHHNSYWDLASGTIPHVLCTTPSSCGTLAGLTTFTTLPWGFNSEEDTGSVIRDPAFLDYSYPANKFTPAANFSDIGFYRWDNSKAGRLNPVIGVPFIPNTWPLTLINANNDYLGSNNPPPTALTVTMGATQQGATHQ